MCNFWNFNFWSILIHIPHVRELTCSDTTPAITLELQVKLCKIGFWTLEFLKMTKLCHVITPWRSGLETNSGWFPETPKRCLLTIFRQNWANSIPSCPYLGIKRSNFCQNSNFLPSFWSRDYDVIGHCQNFLNYPKPQFRSISTIPVVAQLYISFGSPKLSSAKLLKNGLTYRSHITYPSNRENFVFSVLSLGTPVCTRKFLRCVVGDMHISLLPADFCGPTPTLRWVPRHLKIAIFTYS